VSLELHHPVKSPMLKISSFSAHPEAEKAGFFCGFNHTIRHFGAAYSEPRVLTGVAKPHYAILFYGKNDAVSS
jgi:hypothetical protein